MRYHLVVMGLLVATLVGAPARGQEGAEAAVKRANEIGKTLNDFAVDLYGALKPGDGNLLVSPYSVAVALHMARGGARGTTADEMARALHVMPAESHDALAALVAAMENPQGGEGCYELHVANSLWAGKRLQVEDAFARLLRDAYRSDLYRADFVKAAEEARQAINQWVEGKTRDRIKDLIPMGVLNDQTRMVLVNALYFKAAWQEDFYEGVTRNQDFFTESGRKVSCEMMRQTEDFPYAEDARVQVLELPYRRGGMSMVIVLPRKRGGLPDVEKKLSREQISRWCAALRSEYVGVEVPKFKMSSSFRLSEVLQSLGIKLAFDAERADFSGITGSEPLFISEALHKTWIAVDEEGTEAAAATAMIGLTGAAMPDEPKSFIADHPFLFFIRHGESGTILFMGRVSDPTQKE